MKKGNKIGYYYEIIIAWSLSGFFHQKVITAMENQQVNIPNIIAGALSELDKNYILEGLSVYRKMFVISSNGMTKADIDKLCTM